MKILWSALLHRATIISISQYNSIPKPENLLVKISIPTQLFISPILITWRLGTKRDKKIIVRASHALKVEGHENENISKLECGPMPNLMVALPNIGGAICSTPQSLADAHY